MRRWRSQLKIGWLCRSIAIGHKLNRMKKLEFEFDPNKSQSNKNKHGIDFIEAQALWLDAQKVEIPAQTKNCLLYTSDAADE